MKQVFSAGTSLEAHVISHLLEQAGIKTNITGDALSGARGELPAQDLATIWVLDDADYEQARGLIKEWQSQQLPELQEEKPSEKNALSIGIAVAFAFLFGVGFSAYYFYVPIEMVPRDYNRDGKDDMFYHYTSHGFLDYVEVDFNFDDKIDMVEYYGYYDIIEKAKIDIDFDGQYESQVFYKNGRAVRENIDNNHDGKTDIAFFYGGGGIVNTQHIFDKETGKLRKIANFENGRLVSARFDSDNDGEFDTEYVYDRYEEIISQKKIGTEN